MEIKTFFLLLYYFIIFFIGSGILFTSFLFVLKSKDVFLNYFFAFFASFTLFIFADIISLYISAVIINKLSLFQITIISIAYHFFLFQLLFVSVIFSNFVYNVRFKFQKNIFFGVLITGIFIFHSNTIIKLVAANKININQFTIYELIQFFFPAW